MKALIQRVTQASVTVDHSVVGSIDGGLLVFLGIEQGDTPGIGARLLERILNYRVFADATGRMNLSVRDVGGSVLIVSQFTLVADTRKGLRPSFSKGASPVHGEAMVNAFVGDARVQLGEGRVATGRFGADMKVALMNDGPVTFLLEVAPDLTETSNAPSSCAVAT